MTSRERSLMWRQLALMLGQGVPILRAFDALMRQESLKPVFDPLARAVSGGQRLSVAMKSQSGTFPILDRSMVAVGENSGSLILCMERLADWLERDATMRQNTLKALTYPLFVLGVACVLVLLLIGTVIPAFRNVLTELNVPLPLPTRLILSLSGLLSQGWPFVLGLAALAWGGWVLREYARTDGGQRQLFKLAGSVPVAGRLLTGAALARYTDVLGLLLEAGTDLLSTLKLAAEASGNPYLREDAPHLVEAIRHGDTLSEYLGQHHELYTRQLAQLVRSGEESDRLLSFLRVAARTLALEVELLTAMLTALMEPILITFVAGVVGAIVLSVLLPIYGSLRAL